MLGPYEIIDTSPSPLAFKLDLPAHKGIHPYFHVSLLEHVKPGHPNQPQDPPPHIEIEGQEEYIINKILDSRISEDDGFDYLVHWQGYSSAHDSWEPWEEVHQTLAFRKLAKEFYGHPEHHFPAVSCPHNFKKNQNPVPPVPAPQKKKTSPENSSTSNSGPSLSGSKKIFPLQRTSALERELLS